MSPNSKNITIAATPTSPFLPPLLQLLSHKPEFNVKLLTRETSITISIPHSHPHSESETHSHNHNHSHTNGTHNHDKTASQNITHIQTDFTPTSLSSHLQETHTLILLLHGTDIHLSSTLITTCTTTPSIKLIVPSEFGLPTSNPRIQSLLPPYKTRQEIQTLLQASGIAWRALYTGISLEDGMKSDGGVLGIDVLWGSVVVFPHEEGLRVPVSPGGDVARWVVGVVEAFDCEGGGEKGNENEVYRCSFKATLEEIVKVVEKKLDREFDRYEGLLEGARKEAKERMERGYFDGGVALMGRVAVWDGEVKAWEGWRDVDGEMGKGEWEGVVGEVAEKVRSGDLKGEGGCGC